ncbi:hypothetical protein [Sulfuriferula sp.]|uniref:hypothetical protein n=1 Tax=Sulfuriferula sp. TaxID=2025307 RepID=UPI00272FF2F9|nr:hypothetical protein [Sulfuriferula sp.]MDP2024849.1 hypothetical protein [Sulfuriferula sp.]
MTQWYSKDLGDGIDANTPSHLIQEAFLPLFAAAGQPIDMAVFSRYDLEKNIVTAYFSPGAAALAKMFGAQACEKPKRENSLRLLVGDQQCLQFFYPSAQ